MSPPVGADLLREVLAGGLVLEGTDDIFPSAIQVATSAYALDHDAEVLPEPFAFRPERWIMGSSPQVTAESVMAAESTFCLFSIGNRGCVGKNLAYLGMMITMARLLCRMDIRAVEGDVLGEGRFDLGWGRRNKGHYQLKDYFASHKEGPLVQFRMRSMGS